MKFRCLQRIFTFLIGVIVGVGLVFGGIAYAVFVLKMDQVNNMTGNYLELSEEIGGLSVFGYATGVVSAITAEDATVGSVETALGVDKLSSMLADTLKVDREAVKVWKIKELPKEVSNSITLQLIVDMGISLPDIPLFKDPVFLSKPVAVAFNEIFQQPMGMFFDTAGNPLLETLGRHPMSELGETIDALTLGDLGMTVDPDHPSFMDSLITIPLKDINDPVVGVTATINKMPLSTFGISGTGMLAKIADLEIGKLGDPVDGLEARIKTVTLGEIIGDDGGAPNPIINALRDTELGNLSQGIRDLKIGDVFPDEGFLSSGFINRNNSIMQLSQEITDAIAHNTLAMYFQAHILASPVLDPTSSNYNATIAGKTLPDAMALLGEIATSSPGLIH